MTVDVDLRSFGPANREPESLPGPTRVVRAETLPSSTPERARQLANADIVVVTGAGEAAERAVLEAQASGTPVVVTASSTAALLVRPRRTGLVCGGEEAAIALAVEELAHAPALRSRLAAEALESARAHHAAVTPAAGLAAAA